MIYVKPLLIIGLVLAVILVSGYWTLHEISNNAGTLFTQSSRLEESINNGLWDQSEERFDTLVSTWNRIKALWTVLLHHSEIDSMNITLARIEQYIKSREKGLVLGEIASLKVLIQHVPKKERLTLENIF